MIHSILIGIALLATLGGGSYFAPYDFPPFEHDALLCQVFPSSRLCADLSFGAVSFPASLDVFENPGATASVATVVTHSTQHGNANDALEALEAKLGTGASTALSGTVLAGNGAGTSIWSTFATTTNLRSTNIVATGSSTLQNFTFTTATGTSATTTNFFSTNASITNASSTVATTTNFYGADLATCQSTNALTWNGGKFGCLSVTTGGPTVFSTTTAQQMATTTFRTSDGSLPNTSTWEITFVTPKTVGTNANTSNTNLTFNNVRTTTYSYAFAVWDATPANENTLNATQVVLQLAVGSDLNNPQQYYRIKIINNTGVTKVGDWDGWSFSTTSTHQLGTRRQGMFFASTTDAITRIDIGTDDPLAMFGTSTQIQIIGY